MFGSTLVLMGVLLPSLGTVLSTWYWWSDVWSRLSLEHALLTIVTVSFSIYLLSGAFLQMSQVAVVTLPRKKSLKHAKEIVRLVLYCCLALFATAVLLYCVRYDVVLSSLVPHRYLASALFNTIRT